MQQLIIKKKITFHQFNNDPAHINKLLQYLNCFTEMSSLK